MLIRVGVSMSRCSCRRSVPSLRVRPLGSSKSTVSSTCSRRASHPTLGSKSFPDKCQSRVGTQCCLFGGWVVIDVGCPCSIRARAVGRCGW